MNHNNLIICALLSIFFLIHIQGLKSQTIRIDGYVNAFSNEEALIDAFVHEANTNNTVATNEYGYFSIKVEENTPLELVASYIGYEEEIWSFTASKDTSINFYLKEMELDAVVVVSSKFEDIREVDYLKNIDVSKLSKLPTFGGEKDIIKSMSLYPGVSTGSEGTSNLFVRGGSADQNLFFLDQFPVYNVNHLGGYLSVFNSEVINHIDFYKDGFPANLGGRLSSVIDISLKEGNKEKRTGGFSIGLLTSKFLLEGPIKSKRKASYIVGLRSSYLTLINAFRKREGAKDYFNYWLYDINAKFNIQTKNNGKLFMAFYSGRDIGIAESDGASSIINNTILKKSISTSKVNWGNTTLSARYIKPINDKLFLKIGLGYTQYIYELNNETEDQSFIGDTSIVSKNTEAFNSKISSIIFKTDFDYASNNNVSWKFGLYSEFQKLKTSNLFALEGLNSAIYAASYIENEIKKEKLKINVGLRYSIVLSENRVFPNIQPRLKLNYLLNSKSALDFSYSRMVQIIHQLTLTNQGLPVDTWFIPNKEAPPGISDQISIAFKHSFKKSNLLSFAMFYKKQRNLLEYRSSDQDFLENSGLISFEQIAKDGEGEIYGFEFFTNQTFGKLEVNCSYTLSWNYRKFEELNNGKEYLFQFDRRNDLSLSAAYSFNDKWSINALFIFQTGSRITIPISVSPLPENESTIRNYAERNNATLPNYHRLDLSIQKSKETKKRRLRTWELTLYNVYNRINPNRLLITGSSIFDASGEFSHNKPIAKISSQFPFMPTISYSLKF